MKTLFFWLLLFILLSSYDRPLGAQNLTETDSLLQQLRVTPDDTNKIKTYARLGWIYGETNSNTILVRKYADSIRMLSQKLNYAKGIALSHFYYGFNARHEGNYDEALAHLHIFIKYFAKTGDSTKVANGLFHVGVVESIRGNYERSLSIYFRILNIYKFKQQPYGVATALSSIGISHQYAEKYDKAIACFRHALQILDSLENGKPTQAIAVEYGHLGSVYLDLQKSDSAKRYFLQFLKISKCLWGLPNQ